MPSNIEYACAEAKIPANPLNMLDRDTELPAFARADYLLTVSRAMKLGPNLFDVRLRSISPKLII